MERDDVGESWCSPDARRLGLARKLAWQRSSRGTGLGVPPEINVPAIIFAGCGRMIGKPESAAGGTALGRWLVLCRPACPASRSKLSSSRRLGKCRKVIVSGVRFRMFAAASTGDAGHQSRDVS